MKKQYTGKELYDMQRELGLSEYKLAKRLGLSRSIVHNSIYRYKQKFSLFDIPKEPSTEYYEENENELNVRGYTRVRSLDQLIDAFKIDTEKWEVKNFTAEKWDSATDETEKFLIKASFVRRKTDITKPIVPINVTIQPSAKTKKTSQKQANSTIALFDVHFGFRRNLASGKLDPFHNRHALSIVHQVVEREQPEFIIFGGDILDMSEWSEKFMLEPEFYFTTQAALKECAWWIGKFKQASPESKMIYLAGNHEKRLEILLTKRIAAMMPLHAVDNPDVSLASMDNLLGLSRMGIKYIDDYPDGRVYLTKQTIIEHGYVVRNKPGATAAAMVEQSNYNVIFGHKHTIEKATRTIEEFGGRRYVIAACGGCLCRIDGTVPGSNMRTQWQNGFVIVRHCEEMHDVVEQHVINVGNSLYYNNEILYADNNIVTEAEEVVKQ